MEGTYPLPEAQVDRFMFSLRVGYPSIEEEVRIIKGTTGTAIAKATAALGPEEVVRLQEYVRGMPIADSVVHYAARLVAASRPGGSGRAELHKYIAYGASPRASQCLVLGAKACALLAGRFHVDFADIRALAAPVLRHRLVLNFHARADKVDADTLVERLLASVPQEA
jgi:MoxR-like ATPase